MSNPTSILIRTRRACAIALAGLAVIPAAASAATVHAESDVLVMRAAPGENSLRVEGGDAPGTIQLAGESLPTVVSGSCQPAAWSATAVECTPPPGGVRIEAGDGDDTVSLYSGTPAGTFVSVVGADGNDTLAAETFAGTVRLDGGVGSDKLAGSDHADALLGGPGDDRLSGRGGADDIQGGDGADNVSGDFKTLSADRIDGGAGVDVIDSDWTVAFGQPQPPVSVSLDGQANDGRPGEGDNVIAVETIHLSFPATLVAGGDAVDFEVFNSPGAATLVGSPGADRLRTYDAHDTIDAGAGDDWIEAGHGNDVITGGPGQDSINAGPGSGSCNFLVCRVGSGNDTIHARDGEADSIDCGVGNDTANVDPQDTTTGCETVNVQSGPTGGGPSCKVPRVKRGSKPAAATKKLRKAGCKGKIVKTRSRAVKAGRVVKLSHKAGRTLKRGAVVRVYVSRAARR